MENLKLGSLFDGSGTFPLAGIMSGMTPVWASEVEPFPIRVTTKRFPGMKHLGDVSKVDGGKVEPVDVITFSSPCQDLSIAGKREGLEGSKSNLFFQAVRIIKEMREATSGVYPRFALWKNVPGALSSKGGEDFRAVIENICGIRRPAVHISRPKKWRNAGEILGDGYSVAWRVLDAQFWGVPQRRKRVFLVADFNDGGAGKILFESEGVSGYSAQGFRAWQRASGCVAKGIGEAVGYVSEPGLHANYVLNDQGGKIMEVTENITGTLRAESHGHAPIIDSDAPQKNCIRNRERGIHLQ